MLAREYSEPDLLDVHRLSVDAYAVQHPGQPTSQSIKSVGIHLIRLYFTVEQGFDVREANQIMVAMSKIKHLFNWLKPPENLGKVNVNDVAGSKSLEEHRTCVREWAQSAWDAWEEHHETVKRRASSLNIS